MGSSPARDRATMQRAFLATLAASLLIATTPFVVGQPLAKLLELGAFWPAVGCVVFARLVLGVAAIASPARPPGRSRWRALWKDEWLKQRVRARQHTAALVLGLLKLTLSAAAALALLAALAGLALHVGGGRLFSSFVLLSVASFLAQLVGGIWLVARELAQQAAERLG